MTRKRRVSLQHVYHGPKLRIEMLPVPTEQPVFAPSATRIAPDQWAVVAREARVFGLRAIARQYGVSHETVRQIVRRATCDSVGQFG